MTLWKNNNARRGQQRGTAKSRNESLTTVWRALALALAYAASGNLAIAQQQPQQTITPAFRDADITQIIEAVSTITGRTFIVDPRVRAQVTILSSTPMSPDAFYQAFLSILQVHGFVAVDSGNVTKIIPDANQRQVPSNDLPQHVSATSDEVVTQVIEIRNVNAAQLVPSLRPLIPQQGHLAYIPGTNTLVISDRAANVHRMMRIIERLDQAGDEDIDIIRLENASAAEIVRVVNTLFAGAAGAAQQADPGGVIKVVADDRTNSVLISGEQSQRLRMKALITHLDTPLESGGDTQVRYLEYADAEALAGKLKEQVQGIVQAAGPGAAPGAGAAGGGPAAAERSVTIWADPQNNALIVTAPPKIMRSIMSVVDKLDIRRAQVQVEAIIVEINATKASELGVNWAIDGTNSDSTVPIGIFNQAVGGTSILDIVQAIEDPSNIPSGALRGATIGAGRFGDTGTNFAVLIRALQDDGRSNIISTPSIVTLDNEEAEIKVAQEVPFITGQYANTGVQGGGSNIVNPFTTVQREEVGNILKITPQINRGDSVLLKIEQESSFLAQGVAGAVDLITNKRTISTKVMVEDGGIIVLGGLIDDEVRESENRFPILGSIPLIGELFKTRSGSKTKRNLMVFIRPTILRDGVKAAIETNAKYNALRDQQLKLRNGRVLLLPGERQPTLPPIEELSRYADPTAGAEEPAPGTDRTQITPLDEQPPVDTSPTAESPEPPPRRPDVRPPDDPETLRPRAE